MKRPRTEVTRRKFIGQLSAAAIAALTARSALSADAPSRPKRLGIALCGLGSYATDRLLPAIKESKHWKLTGVVTGSPEKGRHWARKNGFPEKSVYGYDTMDRMAANADIDVVYVVTPNGLHARDTIAAARAGKHVICEKPMAISVVECDSMIDACRKAGVRLMIGYRLHYEPHTAEFCRLAREQTFGPFMKIAAENGFDMGDGATAANTWRLNKKLAGGGPLMDMGVYVIQAVCMAKAEAPPVTITAKFGPVTRPRTFSEVEQSIDWTADFADGAEGKCMASYADQVSKIRAEAARGWAEIEYPAFYYDTPILVTSRGTPDFPVVNHQLAQMDGMALELLENRPSLAPAEMGRRDVAIIEAIYAAAKSGQRAEVRV